MQAEVRDRHPDRTRLPRAVVRAQWPVGHVHGRLGDPVHVDQRRAGLTEALVPRAQRRRGQCLPAEDHESEGKLISDAEQVLLDRHEQARGGVQHGHALAGHQFGESLRGAGRPQGRDDQAPAIGERAPDLPDAEVKRVGMQQHPDVGGAEPVPLVGGGEQAGDVAVLDQDALRLPGGARGVDHIGQALRGGERLGIGRVERGQRGRVAVETDHGRRAGRQAIQQVLPADDQRNRRVLQHEPDPVARILRVQRHVRAAGLQHPQDRHDRLDRRLEEQRHQRLRPRPELTQAMSEPIGASVQIPIGNRRALEAQRHRIRRRSGVTLETLVHTRDRIALVDRRAPTRRVVLLGRLEHRQRRHGTGRIGQCRLEQPHVPLRQALDRHGVEQVRAVFPGELQPVVGLLLDEQGDVETRGVRPSVIGLGALDRQPCQRHVGHEDLEDGVAGEIARAIHPRHDLVERRLLVGDRPEHGVTHAVHELVEARLAREVAPQRHGAGEQADRVLLLRPVAARGGGADDHVLLPAVAPEQHVVDGQHRGERRRLPRPGVVPDRTGGRGVQAQPVGRASVRRHLRTGPVGRQLQRLRRAGQPLHPRRDRVLEGLPLHALPLPAREVGILQSG